MRKLVGIVTKGHAPPRRLAVYRQTGFHQPGEG